MLQNLKLTKKNCEEYYVSELVPEAKIFLVQEPIDEDHRDCLWYGGRIAEVEYKGYTFILGAYGDVRATLTREDDMYDIIAEVRDKSNQGRFYEEMKYYIKNDTQLKEFEDNGRLVFENNNWMEVLIDDPEGYQHDTGWVTNSDDYEEALLEMIKNMDEVIKDLESTSTPANKKKKYILVSVVAREISVNEYDSIKEAQKAMYSYFCMTSGLGDEDFDDDFFSDNDSDEYINGMYEDSEVGIDSMSAYVTDGPNHDNYDWKIIEEKK